MYKVTSNRPGFEQTFQFERCDMELYHFLADNAFASSLKVQYFITSNSQSTAVICTITDLNSNLQISSIGESMLNQENPTIKASNEALILALNAFLLLDIEEDDESHSDNGEDESNILSKEMNIIEEADEETEETSPFISDDEVLMFGLLKGKRYGDVKESSAFQHFLALVSDEKHKDMTFPDAERQNQLERLRELAMEDFT